MKKPNGEELLSKLLDKVKTPPSDINREINKKAKEVKRFNYSVIKPNNQNDQDWNSYCRSAFKSLSPLQLKNVYSRHFPSQKNRIEAIEVGATNLIIYLL